VREHRGNTAVTRRTDHAAHRTAFHDDDARARDLECGANARAFSWNASSFLALEHRARSTH